MLEKRRAFTLIELIVVVAIVAIVGVITFFNLQGGQNQTALTSTAQQATALIRQAQVSAASQKNDTAWGVYFSNSATNPFYALISSSTYNSSTVVQTYPLPSGVAYLTSTLPQGSSLTIAFSPISGGSIASTTVSIYSVKQPSLVANIAVTGPGEVTYNSCNGSVGSWGSTASLKTGIDQANDTGVAYNGYVYLIGGEDPNNNETSSVVYAPINANATLGAWSLTTALPSKDYMAASVASNGYVYLMGGYSPGVTTATVLYSTISSNGTLGSWTVTQQLPVAEYNQSAATYNGYIYSMGGENSSLNKSTSTVNYAQISSSGAITSWTPTQALPLALYQFGAVAYNGYLYALGGEYLSGGFPEPNNNTYYAPINANGTLGSWTSTTALALSYPSGPAVAYDGYMYVVGGGNSIGGSTANVISAKINANGSLGSWSQTTALPYQMTFMPPVAYNGYFYSIGGDPSSYTATSTVLFASLCPGGSN